MKLFVTIYSDDWFIEIILVKEDLNRLVPIDLDNQFYQSIKLFTYDYT